MMHAWSYLGMAIAVSILPSLVAQSPLTPVVLEMRIDGTPPVIVSALRSGDDAYIPLLPLLRLVQIPYTERDGATDVCVNGRTVRIDTSAHIVHYDSALYVTTTRLATLLHATFTVDWAELVVTLSDDTILPIAQWRRRAARRLAFRRIPPERMPTDTHIVARSRLPLGAALSYTVIQELGHASAYAVTVGSSILGGSLSASTATGHDLEHLTWHTVWSSHTHVRQITFGESPVLGSSGTVSNVPVTLLNTSLRGITLSNTPVLRAPVYDTLQITGTTGPAWDVELTRNGETIAVDSSAQDGHYLFRVPSSYGATRMTVIAYGPAGEVHQSDHFVVVRDELLPPHTFYYTLSAGICTTPSCRYALTGTLRTSPTAWATIATDIATVASHPLTRLSISTRLGGGVHVLGEHLPGYGSTLSTWYTPSPLYSISGRYRSTLVFPPEPSIRAEHRSEVSYSLRWAPDLHLSTRWTFPSFTIDGLSTRDPNGFVTADIRAALVIQSPLGQCVPFVHQVYHPLAHEVTLWRTTSGADMWLFPNALWRTSRLGRILNTTTLRAHVEGPRAHAMRLTRLSLSMTLPKLGRIEAQLSSPIGANLSVFGLAMSQRMAFATMHSLLSTTRGAMPHMTHDIDGTILVDPSTRHVISSSTPMSNDGGVTGIVFFDTNGNGIYDPGEPPITGADVRAGNRTAQSDSAGRYRMWGFTPFTPIALQLDPLSLQEPGWRPTYGVMSADILPTLYISVDIPVMAPPSPTSPSPSPVTHAPTLTMPR